MVAPQTQNEQNNPNNRFTMMNVIKLLGIFLIVRSITNNLFAPKSTPKQTPTHAEPSFLIDNNWPPGQLYNTQLFFLPNQYNTTNKILLAEAKSLKFGKENKEKSGTLFETEIEIGKYVNGETKNLHFTAIFYKNGLSPDKSSKHYDSKAFKIAFDIVKPLTTKRNTETKFLFSEGKGEGVRDKNKTVYYVHPSIDLRLVLEFNRFNPQSLPEHYKKYIKIDKTQKSYDPIIYWDKFWTLEEDLIAVGEVKAKNISLKFSVGEISVLKFALKANTDKSIEMQSEMMGQMGNELDSIKRMLRDTNPFFLALTMVVSVLHSVFECLAFKNEIAFWKNKTDLSGLSVRTLFVDIFCSVVIFLYLLENETSWMIIVGSFFSIFVLVWKLTKAFDISFRVPTGPGDVLSAVSVRKRRVEGGAGVDTDVHDKLAVKYLCWALMPFVGLYSIYTLFYEEHKGWYQWVLNTLVGSVYTFGFITMCPQLYINYKLKSVAHLPWRMMTYKALNTVVDDLFAFVIKMPILHRVACFRDDVVFAVFLFQKWWYRVDYTRTNEFGYTPAKPQAEPNPEGKIKTQ